MEPINNEAVLKQYKITSLYFALEWLERCEEHGIDKTKEIIRDMIIELSK